jgi:phytoene dehydrogenase-like protein
VEAPGLAPEGHHIFLIHELIPYGFSTDWKKEKEKLAEKTLRKAERIFPGLTKQLVHCEAATPMTLERYTRNRSGAAYGWEQVPLLPRIRHGIRNLSMAGHWTETGGGVLAAAYSGVKAAARILETVP